MQQLQDEPPTGDGRDASRETLLSIADAAAERVSRGALVGAIGAQWLSCTARATALMAA